MNPDLARRSTENKTYTSWAGMIFRCHGSGGKSYRHYGGRGIRVCQRWRDSFEAFLADMGECPPGKSIDRIDNERGYEPGNCRWASQSEQTRNTRRTHWVMFDGKRMSLTDACELAGAASRYNLIRDRVKKGWSLEDAVTKPPGPRGVRRPK